MKRFLPVFAMALFAGTACAASGVPVHRAPTDAAVYIISPAYGAEVGTTFTVRFGLRGMGVAPSGVDKAATGHHHLLIDVDTLPKAGVPIPADASHKHFGGGQTETTLTLTPGTHTLQLELGDMNHVPFSPAIVSPKITVHVK